MYGLWDIAWNYGGARMHLIWKRNQFQHLWQSLQIIWVETSQLKQGCNLSSPDLKSLALTPIHLYSMKLCMLYYEQNKNWYIYI